MKDRRKRCSLFLVSQCALALLFFSGITFSSLRLFLTTERYQPNLISSWMTSPTEVISSDSPPARDLSVSETVTFPDQVLILLKYPPTAPLLTKNDIKCVFSSQNTSLSSPPLSIDNGYLDHQIVRCELPPRGMILSISLKGQIKLPPGPKHDWKSLVYEAVIDRDNNNTTVVFVKGLNLRSGKVSNASRFECVYGSDLTNGQLMVTSEVVSIAQEIVRCKTPLDILEGITNSKGNSNSNSNINSVKVSVKVKGKGILGSIARPDFRIGRGPRGLVKHHMCVCTMLRNQALFLREWVMYHSRIGVERWFVYDNNSDDDIEKVMESLVGLGFMISRHVWPWIKTQEAGFAHCALRARDFCEWVGFIDVDEFLNLPSGVHLGSVIRNLTESPEVAELRVSCHNFGPSGLKRVPPEGVTMGYTCRLGLPERHKSIVQPDKLNPTLINMVHHFHLKDGFKHVNVDRNLMVINHYKYQVWEVFKEKFYRRVATYVADWQQEENVNSKDRAPGLGTRAVEPDDWSSRFCEINDTGLRDWVVKTFKDPYTGILPWQQGVVL
ncbi:glycosyltransferase family 92 protein RCOM_0530710-like [Rutidosis leptorrhynchoides]|uniref:glycosyltransferase family 92 protein RCOM_0530710-like n=1 Tax=Rutidosis leptorrhynchoides TaxID=125765 RepID=UPI003A98DF43